jgi:hypothetical protein
VKKGEACGIIMGEQSQRLSVASRGFYYGYEMKT